MDEKLRAAYAERDSIFAPMDDAEIKKFREILDIHERKWSGDPEVADARHYFCDIGRDNRGRMIFRYLDQVEFDAWCEQKQRTV